MLLVDWRSIAQYFHCCLLMLVACCAIQSKATGQESITGGPLSNPAVPTLDARPIPSPLEQRNLIHRHAGDQDSIASLLKNVQGNDATIEVVVGRGRLITLQAPLAAANGNETPVVAVGDPTVLDFDILPSSRMIRVLGRRVGITDLSVITADGKAYSFEIRVTYDLNLLRAYVRQLFPNADLKIIQMYEHVIVEGEASSTAQVQMILDAMQAFLKSAQVARTVKSSTSASPAGAPVRRPPLGPEPNGENPEVDPDAPRPPFEGGIDEKPDATATLPTPKIINLIRVPGVQQVMLQVKIAEVDRTALRNMGATVSYRDSSNRVLASVMGSSRPGASDDGSLFGLALGQQTTSFAILPNTSLKVAVDALRANRVLTILAEPNLMAMHGQKASFMAGGEFPVPVPQGGGLSNTFTVEFKKFGVLLDFVPYIMDDGAIRLHVAPEVSTIDPTIGVVSAGISIPGVNTRRASTTVELRQGQTLALAGLLQVSLQANTNRLPGLGDVPYLGPFFSNNSHQRTEKELVILVSPQFVDAMEPHQVGPLPGCEVRDPDDHEFYMLNRIESRHPGLNYRATNGWDDPLRIRDAKTRKAGLFGPYGYSK
jgi:pilus assembly protein CpaC